MPRQKGLGWSGKEGGREGGMEGGRGGERKREIKEFFFGINYTCGGRERGEGAKKITQ